MAAFPHRFEACGYCFGQKGEEVMGEVLFHPNLNVSEAAVIAREQGGRLVWRQGRVRLIKAKLHVDASGAAVKGGEYGAALCHIAAARRQIEELEMAK